MLLDDTANPLIKDQTVSSITNKQIVIITIVIFILSIFGFLIGIKVSEKKDMVLNFGSRKFRVITLIGLSIIITIVLILGLSLIGRNRKEIIAETEINLRIVLENSGHRLGIWIDQKRNYMEHLGSDPELVILTEHLLAIDSDKESLLSSAELADIRNFFKKKESDFPNIGFFVIDPEHISIGSRRDTNIGTENLIAKKFPHLLEHAFMGEVVFVPPMESDVALLEVTGKDRSKNPDTMFFLGPIRQSDGRIIAVMTLRIDPSDEFSQALQFSKIRETNDVYAINRNGLLLSKSRFDEDLRKIGLIENDQPSALNIEIRNPGVNMLEGKQPLLSRPGQPLTHMAATVVQMGVSADMTGGLHNHSTVKIETEIYRDYRGLDVFSAALWEAEFGLGVIAEIDVSEALHTFYSLQLTVFIVFGVTIFLSTAAILFILILGDRTNRTLVNAKTNLEGIVAERTKELSKEIEEKVETEVSLRKLSAAIEEGPLTVVITDKNGIIEYVNPEFTKVTGYTSQDAIGKNPSILKSEDTPTSLYNNLWKTIRGGNVWKGEMFNKIKNGSKIWESVSISPIVDLKGKIVNFVAVKEDITARKKTEEQLKQIADELERNRAKLNAILSSLPDSLFIIDEEGTYIEVIQREETIQATGVLKEHGEAQDQVGKNLKDILPPPAAKKGLDAIRKAIETGITQRVDFEIETTMGIRSFDEKFTPIIQSISGKPEVVIIARDNTDIKQLNKELETAKNIAEEATRAKSDFLANMSH
ncbi:PAS domain S-box protein, partial [bacterium]|nr:PAS domain S-box protein [bacterium]